MRGEDGHHTMNHNDKCDDKHSNKGQCRWRDVRKVECQGSPRTLKFCVARGDLLRHIQNVEDEYPAQGGGVRDFKWKWWHVVHAESNAKSDAVLQLKQKTMTNFERDPNCAPWCSWVIQWGNSEEGRWLGVSDDNHEGGDWKNCLYWFTKGVQMNRKQSDFV